jgi:hypothetical protein
MEQILDSGKSVFFGQSLQEAEKLFSCKAEDFHLPKISRPGIDKIIKLKNVILRFDTDRLVDIEFKHPYQFINPPTPYPEQWRNFNPIGEKRIFGGMSRDDFLSYLAAWEERAKGLGIEKTESGDRTDNQYSMSAMHNEYMDGIHISTGSTRRTGGKGKWSDGWGLFFATTNHSKITGTTAGTLLSLSAFRDEFNTVARRIVKLSPDLPPHGTTPWTSSEE